MNRLSKRLGAVLIAVCSVSALLAPAAAQAAPQFEAEAGTTGIHALGTRPGHEHYFSFPNQFGGIVNLSCNVSAAAFSKATFPGTTLSFVPSYSECTLGGEATVKECFNECSYQFVLVAKSSPPTGTFSIVCPAGKEIKFEGPKCTVHIPPQTGRQHVVFSNTEPGLPAQRDIDATISTSELSYKLTPGCPGVFTTETKKTGTFTEEWTLVGTTPGIKAGIWVK